MAVVVINDEQEVVGVARNLSEALDHVSEYTILVDTEDMQAYYYDHEIFLDRQVEVDEL